MGIHGENMQVVEDPTQVKALVEKEYDRTGGIFQLAPTWVGRPGIIVPGRRLKLKDIYMSRNVAVNERWLASVTYADNGQYNKDCPPDHGYSYMIIDDKKVMLRRALELCGELLLGAGDRRWNVLSKFFDNWGRIPHHLHPCEDHVRHGLSGKPESYYFPLELNMNPNAFPATPFGVDRSYSDAQILSYLRQYFQGDNRLTDMANTINLVAGTGWFMPPCTLHAPGSLVTYELQASSDVTCIPESRVGDMVMPADLVDRDIPVSFEKDGEEAVYRYVLSMIRCPNSGNADNFRQEYFRPPVNVRDEDAGRQEYVIYRTGKASDRRNRDLYSAKHTTVRSKGSFALEENAPFGVIVLAGHGALQVEGKEPLAIESASIYHSRTQIGADECFVAAGAARRLSVHCASAEDLSLYQHFASDSNSDATELDIPEFLLFGR